MVVSPFSRQDLWGRQQQWCPTPLMSPALAYGWRSSLTSLRRTPLLPPLQPWPERKRGMLIPSSEVTQGVSRSEVKEETAKRAGDMSEGSRPVALLSENKAKTPARQNKDSKE